MIEEALKVYALKCLYIREVVLDNYGIQLHMWPFYIQLCFISVNEKWNKHRWFWLLEEEGRLWTLPELKTITWSFLHFVKGLCSDHPWCCLPDQEDPMKTSHELLSIWWSLQSSIDQSLSILFIRKWGYFPYVMWAKTLWRTLFSRGCHLYPWQRYC